MKAKKLPSGNWRTRVYLGEKAGKKIIKSFTAPTKRESEFKAAEFLRNNNIETPNSTIRECVEAYISSRANILSPATIRGYKSYQKALEDIGSIKLSNLTSQDVQLLINEYAINHSPKSVKELYTLLSSSIKAIQPNIPISVSLPARKSIERQIPTDNDIELMLANSHGNLKKAIELAAFCSLRRGECCALRYDDINGNTLHVHSDVVKGPNGWVHKDMPKNASSDRFIKTPDFVIFDLLNEKAPKEKRSTEFCVNCTPSVLSNRFNALMKALNMNYRFHDLRHYYASLLHAIGIPNQYIQQSGGWKSDAVLNSIYRNVLRDKQNKFENQTLDYMEKKFS